MIKKIIDWIKQKRNERKRLRNLEFWGYAGPMFPEHKPYRISVKTIRINEEKKLSYGNSDRDMLPLQCDKVDTVCWEGCPHYRAAIFFRVFECGYTFICRYHPIRIDAEQIDRYQEPKTSEPETCGP